MADTALRNLFEISSFFTPLLAITNAGSPGQTASHAKTKYLPTT
jgi:hypothetical protein